jgi:hypothetical protein
MAKYQLSIYTGTSIGKNLFTNLIHRVAKLLAASVCGLDMIKKGESHPLSGKTTKVKLRNL